MVCHGALAYVHQNETHICAGGICIPQSYDKYKQPKKKTDVSVWFSSHEADLTTVSEVNDNKFTLTLHAIFNMGWDDPRWGIFEFPALHSAAKIISL